MFILGFLLAGTGLNLALGFLVQFKSYRPALRLTLLGLSFLFTAHVWLGYGSVFTGSADLATLLHRALLALDLLIGFGMLLLTRAFLRSGDEPDPGILPKRFSLVALAGAGSAVGVLLCFLPGYMLAEHITHQIHFAD